MSYVARLEIQLRLNLDGTVSSLTSTSCINVSGDMKEQESHVEKDNPKKSQASELHIKV